MHTKQTRTQHVAYNPSIDPYKLIKVGANETCQGDPLIPIEKELSSIRYVKIPGLPSFTGIYSIY